MFYYGQRGRFSLTGSDFLFSSSVHPNISSLEPLVGIYCRIPELLITFVGETINEHKKYQLVSVCHQLRRKV